MFLKAFTIILLAGISFGYVLNTDDAKDNNNNEVETLIGLSKRSVPEQAPTSLDDKVTDISNQQPQTESRFDLGPRPGVKARPAVKRRGPGSKKRKAANRRRPANRRRQGATKKRPVNRTTFTNKGPVVKNKLTKTDLTPRRNKPAIILKQIRNRVQKKPHLVSAWDAKEVSELAQRFIDVKAAIRKG